MIPNNDEEGLLTEITLERVMASVAENMRVKFEGLTAQISHGPTKGTAREEIVRSFLSEYLPESVEIGAGEIVDVTGGRSDQIDLVVFDRLRCPKLVQVGDVRVYPAEGVYAVLQVKSNLNMNRLESAVKNIRSAKKLVKTAFYPPTGIADSWMLYGKRYKYFPMMGYVFAFKSIDIVKLGKGLDELNRSLSIPPEQQIDALCLLDRGVIGHESADETLISWAEPTDPEAGDTTVTAVRTKKALLLFYIMLHDMLSIATMRPVQMQDYIPPQSFIFGDDEPPPV